MFCIYLRTNSDLCHLELKLVCFYNRFEKCLLRGSNWVFKYSSLCFVFKGLMYRIYDIEFLHLLIKGDMVIRNIGAVVVTNRAHHGTKGNISLNKTDNASIE